MRLEMLYANEILMMIVLAIIWQKSGHILAEDVLQKASLIVKTAL